MIASRRLFVNGVSAHTHTQSDKHTHTQTETETETDAQRQRRPWTDRHKQTEAAFHPVSDTASGSMRTPTSQLPLMPVTRSQPAV